MLVLDLEVLRNQRCYHRAILLRMFLAHCAQRSFPAFFPILISLVNKILCELIARADLATGGIAALAKLPRRSQISVFPRCRITGLCVAQAAAHDVVKWFIPFSRGSARSSVSSQSPLSCMAS